MAFYKKNIFDPKSKEPFTLSRSKVDLFVECPRCLYLDQRLSVKRPSIPSFTLNNAVDELFKKEFDIHRAKREAHPLMKTYGIDAVPFQDERMEEWRDALRRGIIYHHEPSCLRLRGGIDDIWQNKDGELIVVDYKATAGKEEVNLNDKWKAGYKRQVEIYQWLFRQNGFPVSKTAYFVYANGQTDRKAFDGTLEFDVTILPYEGDDTWIPDVLMNIRTTLMSDEVPKKGDTCEYCAYRDAAGKILLEKYREGKAKK